MAKDIDIEKGTSDFYLFTLHTSQNTDIGDTIQTIRQTSLSFSGQRFKGNVNHN